MKASSLLAAVAGLVALPLWAQRSEDRHQEVPVLHKKCTQFYKTPPLKVLLKYLGVDEDQTTPSVQEANDKKQTADWSTVEDHGIPETGGRDPVVQLHQGNRQPSPLLRASWNGVSGPRIPPDPSGAAGPEHYVQAVNAKYRVYAKDGTSLSPSFSLRSLWPGSNDKGDPIVMYDRYADRWFISQLQQTPQQILIAISETSDPLGAYYAYVFDFEDFPDYPKYGVWSNGYYMSINSPGRDCVVFEREKMLVGDPDASMVAMKFPTMPAFFRSYAPIYAEGGQQPATDAPFYFFHLQDDAWQGVLFDHIKVLKVVVDWDTPSNSLVSIDQKIPISALNSVFTPSWDDIQQAGTDQKLDAVPSIFMYRVQYRAFDTYNAVVLTTTVDVDNNNRAGIRWIELRENGDGKWYVYQESTYAPNDGNSRWLPSAAMDADGNIGLAYSCGGGSTYPGIRYTGRWATDPTGEMTIKEQIAVNGKASQEGINRYGDYGQMAIDPVDDATFWFTGEYIDANGNPETRIFSFLLSAITDTSESAAPRPFFNLYQSSPSQVKLIWKHLKDDRFDLLLFDDSGRKMAQKEGIEANLNQLWIDLPSLASGVYIAQIRGANTRMSEKVYLGR